MKLAAQELRRGVSVALLPLIAIAPEGWVGRLGLLTLADLRVAGCLPHLRGRLLDVGAGDNRLVQAYRSGMGWGVDWVAHASLDVVADGLALPFGQRTFDSVSFLANLNYFEQPDLALGEAVRVLAGGGRIVLTMIPAWVGTVRRFVRRWILRRPGTPLTRLGMSAAEVTALAARHGLQLTQRQPLMWGLNYIYVLELA